jgi:SAM-dependent methyltransferase
MTEANAFERRRWNDDRWTGVWPRRERLTDRVTPVLLEAVAPQPGEHALDVGCGGGRTTLAAAAAVGTGGHAVGADVSAQLLELARRRASEAGTGNVDFERADLQTDAVPGVPFDVALSQFGVMFFDDPVRAFANVRAHLRPGGRLVFACWQALEHNTWHPAHAAAPFVVSPPEPPPGKSRSGPFTLADPAHTRALLEAAGFVGVGHEPHTLEVTAPQDAVFDDVQLHYVGVPDEQIDEARGAIEEHLGRFESAGGDFRFPLAFQLFSARQP